MKPAFTILLILLVFNATSQRRSYVHIGPAAYLAAQNGTTLAGGSVGAGSSIGHAGAGIAVELLSRDKQVILPVYADVRFYLKETGSSAYVTLQPGYNFRNSQDPIKPYTSTRDKGGIYLGAGVGYYSRKKSPGLNLQFKYVFLQDRFTMIQPNRRQVLNTHQGLIGISAFILL